ncbi:MAG: transglutaminase domain-containing protein [Lachnospiraceae bacterium]|nr:transglutaminase domain-containing protein [Lachnospiraceae bacterium]
MSARESRWRRKKAPAQIELTGGSKRDKYDALAALAEALLVFMVSFGAVGGFLNAYRMEYNQLLCLFGTLGLSFLLSFIYETRRRWFTNLCMILIFVGYAYVAVSRFWILNSGAYAMINEIYEDAQAYLGVVGGGLYNLTVEDSYLTISAIGLFVCVVLVILMVIRLQYKASLIRTVIITFTLYLVPIYFERTPDPIYLFLLLSGYITLGILQTSKVKEHIAAQIKQALPVGMAIAAVVVLVFAVLLPRVKYRTLVPKNASKAATEQSAVAYAQYGVMALLMNNSSGAGTREGRLAHNAMFMPDDETDLIVRFTPYSMDPVYLKAYTGLDYDGGSWSRATDRLGPSEGILDAEAAGRSHVYDDDSELQSKGLMEVFVVEPKELHTFYPYYAGEDDHSAIGTYEFPEGALRGDRFTYYPSISDTVVPGADEQTVSERYLTVPKICEDAVAEAVKEAGLSGTPQEIAKQITDYFQRDFRYTLRPGYYFGGMDYISYFLSKNKKGFCTHFASAGTMMFRYMGIPARYAEGYVFTYTDVVTDGDLLKDVDYSKYYDGYSPLGDTALVELEVPDANGHAWIEIWIEDYGWTVVEVTPAAIAEEEEETGGFWESILNSGSEQNRQANKAQQQAAKAFENAMASGVSVLMCILVGVGLFFVARYGLKRYGETRLSGKDRLELEYGRLTGKLKESDEGFAKLTTPEEELDYMAKYYQAVIPEGFKEEFYQTFFAPEKERDYERLRGQVKAIRKSLKKPRA